MRKSPHGGGWSNRRLDAKGKVHVKEEVEFLSQLAGHYRKKGQLESRDSWIDLLKVHLNFVSCSNTSLLQTFEVIIL